MPDTASGPGEKILEQVRRARESHLAPEAEEPSRQYLSFRLEEGWYALRVEWLVEVLPLPKITRVPCVPDHILGVMNLRGEVLSVIDPKRLFSLSQEKPAIDSALVVVEHGGVRTGLLVDAVGDLVNLTPTDFTEEPVLVGKAQRGCFEGAARLGDVPVSLIHLESLLHLEGMYSSVE